MMRILPIALVAFLTASLVSADDAKVLDGKWAIESVTKSGKVDTTWAGGSREFSGETYTMSTKAGKSFTGKLKVDAEKKTIDLLPGEGNYKGKTLLGIYSLEGDTLKIVFAEPGKERPTKIESTDGSGLTLAVHKKVK